MHRINHFVGIKEDIKIYCVLCFENNEYIGIATEESIEVYGSWGYERKIDYENWQWKDYNLFKQFAVHDDYNKFTQEGSTGLELIEYANRYLTRQIEYTSEVFEDLLYETFGAI